MKTKSMGSAGSSFIRDSALVMMVLIWILMFMVDYVVFVQGDLPFAGIFGMVVHPALMLCMMLLAYVRRS